MSSVDREFDVLLWGVTGWTGVHLLEYFVSKYPPRSSGVKWAIVARNKSKLDKVIAQVSEQENAPWLKDVPFFLSSNDAVDEEKIMEIVSKSSAVTSVVGPYITMGETLVKCCATAGTHYFDITGETAWVKNMIAKYSEIAEKNGAFLASFCGCDSVPSDIGSFFIVQRANEIAAKELNLPIDTFQSDYVEKHVQIRGYVTKFAGNNRVGENNAAGGGGTAATFIAMVEGGDMRAASHPRALTARDDPNTADDKHHPQLWVMKEPKLGKYQWTTHFMMGPVNEKVVRRSRYLLPEVYGVDFSYHEAYAVKSWLTAQKMSWSAFLGYMALSRSWSREWIKKYLPQPSQLPAPKPKDYKPGAFQDTFLLSGRYVADGKEVKKELIGTITFPDEVGWTDTAKMLTESCLSVVQSLDDVRRICKRQGGYITPACLGDIFIERLKASGVEFEAKELSSAKL